MRVEDEKPKDGRSADDVLLDRVESRRRLLKAGLVAVPFLLTLRASPARAQAQGSLGLYNYGGDARGTTGDGGGNRPGTGPRQRVAATDGG